MNNLTLCYHSVDLVIHFEEVPSGALTHGMDLRNGNH